MQLLLSHMFLSFMVRTSPLSFSTVSATEVYSLLKDLDSSKAPGSDGIPASILKNCASVIAPSVATLFNTTIKTGHLPKQFKKATIAPVFKSGDKHVAANYRPISLLPILSKVLEKVIASQLKSYLKEHSLLPAEQFAYRDRHSTEDALVYRRIPLASPPVYSPTRV